MTVKRPMTLPEFVAAVESVMEHAPDGETLMVNPALLSLVEQMSKPEPLRTVWHEGPNRRQRRRSAALGRRGRR